jgi:hypothetical protein
MITTSGADQHHIDADPDWDSTFHFEANPDPDPACHFDADPDADADPDPSFQIKAQTLDKMLK